MDLTELKEIPPIGWGLVAGAYFLGYLRGWGIFLVICVIAYFGWKKWKSNG